MSAVGFLLLAALSFALIYGLYKVVNAAEDKAREWGLYYSVGPLFVHLVAPILVPILVVLLIAGLVFFALAWIN